MTSRILAALILIAVAGLGPAGGASAQTPSLFGAKEVASKNLAPFVKWTGVLQRQAAEQVLYGAPCGELGQRCSMREWQALAAELAGKDALTRLRRVNAFFNRTPYVQDQANYGLADYWATPLQFLIRAGDCEDYAIAKYVTLRALGVTAAELRIVVLDDLNLRIAHAILVAYVDGKAIVLDNQIADIAQAEAIRHYRPIFSINENGWWLHRP